MSERSCRPKDRWDQFEKAREDECFPDHHIIGLFKDWMGGEIWRGWLAGRGRMLEYTLELEEKIKEGGLKGRTDTIFILALCGTGFHCTRASLRTLLISTEAAGIDPTIPSQRWRHPSSKSKNSVCSEQ